MPGRRGRALLLARIAGESRVRDLRLVRLARGGGVDDEGPSIDGRTSKHRVAVKLPVEIDVTVGRDDGLGRLAEGRRPLNRIERGDVEGGDAAGLHDAHLDD